MVMPSTAGFPEKKKGFYPRKSRRGISITDNSMKNNGLEITGKDTRIVFPDFFSACRRIDALHSSAFTDN
jgi:hypothetical protein